MKQGWICPVCGTVYAPWVPKCENEHNTQPAQQPAERMDPRELNINKEIMQEWVYGAPGGDVDG